MHEFTRANLYVQPGELLAMVVTENGVFPNSHVANKIIETFGTLQP